MPDHVHGLIAFPLDERMKGVVAKWKEYVAKKIGISWQRDFFDHRIRDVNSLEEKEAYILNNPVPEGVSREFRRVALRLENHRFRRLRPLPVRRRVRRPRPTAYG